MHSDGGNDMNQFHSYDLTPYVSIATQMDDDRIKKAKPPKNQHQNEFTIQYENTCFSEKQNVLVSLHPLFICEKFPEFGIHSHDFFELTYVYSGAFLQEIDGKEICQTQNQLILLNLGAKHRVWLKHEGDVVFNIMIRKAAVETTFLQLISENRLFFNFFLNSLYHVHQRSNFILFDNIETVTPILDEMVIEFFEQRDFCEHIMTARLLQLFAELARAYNQQYDSQPAPPAGKQLQAVEIMQHIKQHYSTVTLQSVADHFGYSTRQMSRLIQDYTGQHFSDLINEYKIQSVCTYLKNSGIPLNRIMDIVGYQDISYFYKMFYKKTGIHFSDYKRTL